MKYSLFLIVSLAFLIASSCKHDPIVLTDLPPEDPISCSEQEDIVIPNDCQPNESYYSTIEVIFNASCGSNAVACHQSPNDDNDDVSLISYQAIVESMQDDIDDDEDPEDFKIVKVLREDNLGDDSFMPKHNPDNYPIIVSSSFRNNLANYLENWIANGYPNNSCEMEYDTTDVSFSEDVYPIIYWQCIGCHNPESKSKNVCLSDYENIKYNIGKVIYQMEIGYMPYNANNVSVQEIEIIKKWRDQGLNNN